MYTKYCVDFETDLSGIKSQIFTPDDHFNDVLPTNKYFNHALANLHRHIPQGEKVWLEARLNRIGPRTLGASELVHFHYKGDKKFRYGLKEFFVNALTERDFNQLNCNLGNLFEDVGIYICSKKIGGKIIDGYSMKGEYTTSSTPDGFSLIFDRKNALKFITIEIKSHFTKIIKNVTDIPPEYVAQVMAQLSMSGCDSAYFLGVAYILCTLRDFKNQNNTSWHSFKTPNGKAWAVPSGYGYHVLDLRKNVLHDEFCGRDDCDCDRDMGDRVPKLLDSFSEKDANEIIKLARSDNWESRFRYWGAWTPEIYESAMKEKGKYIIPFVSGSQIYSKIDRHESTNIINIHGKIIQNATRIIDKYYELMGREKRKFKPEFFDKLYDLCKDNANNPLKRKTLNMEMIKKYMII